MTFNIYIQDQKCSPSLAFEQKASLDYWKKGKVLETQINENNMSAEKLHICIKMLLHTNMVLRRWVMWHGAFLRRLQNREMEDIRVEGIFWQSFSLPQSGKKQEMNFWNLRILNTQTLNVWGKPLIFIFISLLLPWRMFVCVCVRLKEGNIAVFAQKNKGD